VLTGKGIVAAGERIEELAVEQIAVGEVRELRVVS